MLKEDHTQHILIKEKLSLLFENYYELEKSKSGEKTIISSKTNEYTFSSMSKHFSLTEKAYINKSRTHKKRKINYNSYLESRAKKTFRNFFLKSTTYDIRYKNFRKELPFFNFFNNYDNTYGLISVNDILSINIDKKTFIKSIQKIKELKRNITKTNTDENLKLLEEFNTHFVYSNNDNMLRRYDFNYNSETNEVKISSYTKINNFPKEIYWGKVKKIANKIIIDTENSSSVLKIIILLNETNNLSNRFLIVMTLGVSDYEGESVVAKKGVLSKLDFHELSNLSINEEEELNLYHLFSNEFEGLRIDKSDERISNSIQNDFNNTFKANFDFFIEKIKKQAILFDLSYEDISKKFKITDYDLFTIPYISKYSNLLGVAKRDISSNRYVIDMSMQKAFFEIVKSSMFNEIIEKYKIQNEFYYIEKVIDLTRYKDEVYIESKNEFMNMIFEPLKEYLYIESKSRILKYPTEGKIVDFKFTIIYDKEETLDFLSIVIPSKYDSLFYLIKYNDNLSFLRNKQTSFCLFGKELAIEKKLGADYLSLTVDKSRTTIENIEKSLGVVKDLRKKLTTTKILNKFLENKF